ncbi:MAG: hypothetical protein AAFR91_04220 [Pseudomonadota bacterium]
MRKFVTTLCLLLSGMAEADEVIIDLLIEYQRASGVAVSGLDQDSLSKLYEGAVVYRKVSVTERHNGEETTSLRVIGYRLIDQAREPLWLAALAFDAGYSSRLTERLLETNALGGGDWYQHLDMPWPLRDRHWLIRTEKNTTLAHNSANRLWEHRWSLVPSASSRVSELFSDGAFAGISAKQAEKSVPLPLNNGAWVMGAAGPNRTLVMVHATVDLGGIVPDGLVARQTRKNLTKMLGKIEQDADEAWARYDPSYLIYRGDGSLIKPRQPQTNVTEASMRQSAR